jgi:hypothetical protein
MPIKPSQTSFLDAIFPRQRPGGIACGVQGFSGPQKNAIFPSNLGSSGECRLNAFVPMEVRCLTIRR